jgi:hypothetical protein
VSPTGTALIVCVVLIGGAVAGILVRRRLPETHLDQHAKDVIRLGGGLLATIVGLVLGLLINSAKTNYDTQRDEVRQMAATIAILDQMLDQYGPESRTARAALRQAVPAIADRMWGEDAVRSDSAPFTPTGPGDAAYAAIRSLPTATEAQRFYREQAIQLANRVAQLRLTLYEQSGGHMPPLLLGMLVVWLFVLFASFSLFSPLNAMARVGVGIIALSVSGAIFLILEMYQPFSGLMKIDSAPLRYALVSLAP